MVRTALQTVLMPCLQAPGLRQISVLHDAEQQQLMGSPRLQQDELTGGPIIAPGSESNAAVQEPLADIAGGKSGSDAHIVNPYEQSRLGDQARQVSGQQEQKQQQEQQTHQQASGSGQGGGDAGVEAGKTKESEDEYSEQQQSQQAGGACKQS